MTNALGIPFEYNQWEYFEFVWRFERLVDERNSENKDANEQQGRMSMSNLGVDMSQMNTNQNGE